MKKQKIKIVLLLISLIAVLSSCKKLIAIDTPQNQLTTDKVFADTSSATAALLNIYDVLQNRQYTACNQYLSTYTDETLSTTSGSSNQAYNQSRVPSNDPENSGDWTYLYSAIYQCNLILEQAKISPSLPASFSVKIQGEAEFLRAYAYFYLVNLYGKVPLITSTDVNTNRSAHQSDSATVYKQILNDLTNAKNNLLVANSTVGKVRVNQDGVTALLSKVNLYQRNWASAETLATLLISSGNYTPLDVPANVFLSSGKESILQFSTQTGYVTEATSVIPSSATTKPSYYFTTGFYQSFEAGDLRRTNWTGTNTVTVGGTTTTYYYPLKYKNRVANTASPENLVVFRIAEQYLIRAEARAYQNKVTGANSAEEDVNALRTRAGLPAVHLTDQSSALTAIYQERLHEMFFEDADRFMDLKRTGRLQSVMSANKVTWISTGILFPIPISEITVDANLIQNAGY
jgi:hypothetical protein